MRRIRKSRLSFGFHRETVEIVEKPSILECLFGRGKQRERKPRKREHWESGKELMEKWLR